MTAGTVVPPVTRASRDDQLFPTLTSEQITRVARHGRARPVAQGEILVEAGDQQVPFFVVTAGQVEIVRPVGETEARIVVRLPRPDGSAHTLLVRSAAVSDSMSRFLVRRIEGNPNIERHMHTELVGLEGANHLECVRWRDKRTGSVEARDIKARLRHDGSIPEYQVARGVCGAR